jgi:preprotein translocase subunit YajC
MPTAVPAAPSNLEMLLPFVAIFVIFYFLIIRPQGKKMKQQDKFVGALKRGDDVTLEVASGVKIKMLKKQIASTQAAFFASAQKKDAVAAAATTKKS